MVNPTDYSESTSEPARNMDAMSASSQRKAGREVRLISHSNLLYWWPVWFFGYVCAAITAMTGVRATVDGGKSILVTSGPGVGIVFLTVLLLVIIFTNTKMRGIYSVVAVLTVAFLSVLLAWVGLWDEIFALIPDLNVHMNVGFYIVFSTALFIIWAVKFFIFDRMTVYIVRPGQMTVEHLIGGSEMSYDTRGMMFEQRGDDLFRHLILGLGSGDLQITTTGAKKEEFYVPNVLFSEWKVKEIQKLISVKPDQVS